MAAVTRPPARNQPQDRKPPAKKAVQRKPPASEFADASPDAAGRMRAASQAVANRSTSRKRKPPVSTEQLAAESNTRVEPPDGAPRLRFLFELSRRERAAYMRALDKVSSGIKTAETGEVLEGVAESDDPQALVQRRLAESPSILKVTADLAEAAADVEDLLLTVAEDPAEYAAWAKSAPDESLMQLFGWYMQEAEAGEAPASPI